jgi:hypothetical protein
MTVAVVDVEDWMLKNGGGAAIRRASARRPA